MAFVIIEKIVTWGNSGVPIEARSSLLYETEKA
jgi:hypothetical protein